MKANIHLGKIRGIPVGLHWSWFLVFLLVTVSLGGGYFYIETPGLQVGTRWTLGILTSLLFFGSVLAHEFGHAVVAQRSGIPVHSIHLFMFGGVAHISREPHTAGVEFRIAAAGPLASLGLSAFFFLLWRIFSGMTILAGPSEWLARVNLALAVFNLIPGFPLDGGRIFRSLLWAASRNFHASTRLAANFGVLVAVGFVVVGGWRFFNGDLFNGLWLGFIGVFLYNAASSSRSSQRIHEKLDAISVAEVMDGRLDRVPGNISLSDLVHQRLLPNGGSQFLVAESGYPRGTLSIQEITSVPRQMWNTTTAEQAMIPWACLIQVPAEMSLWSAFHAMESANLEQIAVVQAGEVTGILSRDRLIQVLQDPRVPR